MAAVLVFTTHPAAKQSYIFPRSRTSRQLAMSSSQIFRALENVKDQAKDALYALTSCLCRQSAKVKINGRTCQYATATSNLFLRNS